MNSEKPKDRREGSEDRETRSAAAGTHPAGTGAGDAGGSAPDDATGSTPETGELTEDLVMDVLRPIVDPEIGISIVDLGLIYGVDVDRAAGLVHVRMTLTSPMCPVGPQLMAAVKDAVDNLPGVGEGEVELVWTPPWDPRVHASEEARAMMGIWS